MATTDSDEEMARQLGITVEELQELDAKANARIGDQAATCTFCGTSAETIRVMVAEAASICEACIQLFLEMLEEDRTAG
jgi:transcriptional regulator